MTIRTSRIRVTLRCVNIRTGQFWTGVFDAATIGGLIEHEHYTELRGKQYEWIANVLETPETILQWMK